MQAIFSHRYKDVEREAAAIVKEFDGLFTKNAYVIPATLLSDTEMADTLRALDSAGVYSVKVNPGCNLHDSIKSVYFFSYFQKIFYFLYFCFCQICTGWIG